jgi:MFS family permease
MKVDLKLTDTQLGLLAGTAFAALYAVSGVPTARLAERFSRVAILSIALAVWSAFTTAFAATTGFAQLVIARIGVGVGEAGCSPCAHSLISDYYPRASAYVGGWVTLHYGWRAACVAVGLPGVAMALALRLLVREPPRGLADGLPAPAPAPFALATELAALAQVARSLFLSWPVANVILGLTVASFASYGSWAFIPAYFPRAFGLDYATAGWVLGLVGSVPVALGTLAGGFLTDLADGLPAPAPAPFALPTSPSTQPAASSPTSSGRAAPAGTRWCRRRVSWPPPPSTSPRCWPGTGRPPRCSWRCPGSSTTSRWRRASGWCRTWCPRGSAPPPPHSSSCA